MIFGETKMCMRKPEKEVYECCGQTFETKEELEAHKENDHFPFNF